MAIKDLKTDGTKDFTSLQAWEDWASTQGSADQEARCWGGGNLGYLLIESWLTTPTSGSYPYIYPAAGQRHSGKDDGTGAYMEIVDAWYGIKINEPFVRLEGLRMEVSHQAATICVDARTSKNGIYITDMLIIENTVATAGQAYIGLNLVDVNGYTGTIRNNIILGKYTASATCNGIRVEVENNGASNISNTIDLFNNTLIDVDNIGVWYVSDRNSTGTCTLVVNSTNNAIFAYGNAFAQSLTGGGTVTINQNYCAASDNTVNTWGGTGNQGSKTEEECFVDPPADPTPIVDGPLYNLGTTIGSFSVDAVGNTRPYGAAWDIGAIEWTLSEINDMRTSFLTQLRVGVGTGTRVRI